MNSNFTPVSQRHALPQPESEYTVNCGIHHSHTMRLPDDEGDEPEEPLANAERFGRQHALPLPGDVE